MTILLLALAPAFAESCPVPSHLGELAGRVDAAEQAYASFEVEAFVSSLDEAALILPCLAEVVPPDLTAHYLRMQGLRYFIRRDPSRADEAFAAARSLDATYVFPESLIPSGHSIRAHYDALDLSTVVSAPLAAARTGSVLFNGSPAIERPGLPAIVQILDATGAVSATRYVLPLDPLPSYDAMPLPGVETARRPLSPKVPLVIGGVLAAAASGTMLVPAASSQREFETYRVDDSLDNLEALRGRTNGLAFGSVGAGVLALAGGVGAVLVGKW